MFDLPNQTLESWLKTLEGIQELPISHLSLYNLTFEKHTSFYKNQKTLLPKVPGSELSLQLLQSAISSLEKMNLQRYEISAFAKPGKESRHNLGYWSSRPYLGLGPSACSYWGKKRWKNLAHFNRYAAKLKNGLLPLEYEEELTYPADVREHFILHLRQIKGVDLRSFEKILGKIPTELNNDLTRLKQENYLEIEEDLCKLTKKGLLFYDTIATELIL